MCLYLQECLSHNLALLGSLKADDHEEELMRLTLKDAGMGRMSLPVPGMSCVDMPGSQCCVRSFCSQ